MKIKVNLIIIMAAGLLLAPFGLEAAHKHSKIQKGKKTTTAVAAHVVKERQKFIKRWNPKLSGCKRAPITPPGQAGFGEGNSGLACLLSGAKPIYLDPTNENNYLWHNKPNLEALLKGSGLQLITHLDRGVTHSYLYRPEAKRNVYLLVKYYATEASKLMRPIGLNHFIVGYLMSYPEKDIEYWYKESDGGKYIAKDRKEAKVWIAKNKPTIERWIHDPKNIAKYKIKFNPWIKAKKQVKAQPKKKKAAAAKIKKKKRLTSKTASKKVAEIVIPQLPAHLATARTAYLNHWRPDRDLCTRPARLAGGGWNPTPPEGDNAMACMLAGYKKIWFGPGIGVAGENSFKTRYIWTDKPELKPLVLAHGLRLLGGTAKGSSHEFLYWPVAEQNAFLLLRYYLTHFLMGPLNHYLIGTLLYYPEKDIETFYDDKTEFARHKKEGIAWIKKHRAGIKKWVRNPNNIAKYQIKFNQWDQPEFKGRRPY